MTEHLPKTRPSRSLWAISFAVTAALLVAVGYTQYRAEVKHVSNEWAQTLGAIGALKANQLGEWRKDRLADAVRFAQGPLFITNARDLIQKPNDPDFVKAAQLMLDLNRKGGVYQNTLIASTTGTVLLSSVAASEPLQETTRQAIRSAIATRAPALSGFYRSGCNQVHIDTATPICAKDGQPIAVFILRSDADAFLYPLIRFWPTDSPSAETLLVRRDGDNVVFLNDLRHSTCTNAAALMKLPLTHRTLPAAQAVLGFRGAYEGKDYRDVEVLSDIRSVPNSDWSLVTKVDRSEVLNDIRYHASVIARFVSLGILLAAAITAAGYRRKQSQLYRDLYRSERKQREAHERFETILYSIGDAVIATDDQACVRQMNPVAEHLTGWKEADASGKPLEEVFHIVNEETRQTVENPVWRVLREGQVVGLANHTVLIARDGTERPIADSGAPVRDEHSKMSGVVLVFRDQSTEYAAQKALRQSEAQYSDLFRNMTEGVALHEVICDLQGTPIDYRFLKVNSAFERLTGLRAEHIVGRRVLEVLPGTETHWIETYGTVALEGKAIHFENYAAALRRHFQVTAFCPRPGQFCTIFDDITDRKKHEEERKTLEKQLQQSQRIEAVGRLAGGVAHDFNNMLAVIIGNAELAKERLETAHPLHAELHEIISAGSRSADLVRQLLAFASRQTIMPRILNLNDTISGMHNMLKRLIGEEIALDWSPDASLWQVKLDPSQIDQVLVNLTVNARDAINGVGKISIRTSNAHVSLTAEEANSLDETEGDFILLSISDNGCGMDAETQAHIFEPFFTTKQKEIGTGLGLSTVYGIVKQNRGFIRIVSKPGEGSRFDIYLPRCGSDESRDGSLNAELATPQSATETVLLVEDEPALLALTLTLLKRMGYAVLPASGPTEALKVSAEFSGDIHLLMTDVVMPDMSGHDLWKLLSQQRPKLKSLFVSGYTADIIAHHGIVERDIHFLQKPFSKEMLAVKLRDVLSHPTPE